MTHILTVTGVKSDHTDVFYEAFLKVIQNNNSRCVCVCVCVCVCMCEAVIQHLAVNSKVCVCVCVCKAVIQHLTLNSKVTQNYEKNEGCCRTVVLISWL